MRKIASLAATCLVLAACSNDAEVVSRNLSTAADNFEINRRVVFYNGITGDYILVIEGLCSLEPAKLGTNTNNEAPRLHVTCKTGSGQYKKHTLGLSDNVTYFSEQVDSAPADPYRYRVVFKPSVIIPDVEMR